MTVILNENEFWKKSLKGPDLGEWIVLDRLTDIILKYVDGCIIDIGIGETTLVLLKHSKLFDRTHFSIDKRQMVCDWLTKEHSLNLHAGHFLYCGTSHDFITEFSKKSEQVAVAMLDGSHNYETMQYEVNFFLSKLSVGGVIFVHDTMPWERTYSSKENRGKKTESWRIRTVTGERDDVEIFTWPYTAAYCGLTMILKKDMSRPFYRR